MPIPLLDLVDSNGQSMLTINIEADGRVSLQAAGSSKIMFGDVSISLNRWVLIGVVGKKSKTAAGDAGECAVARPFL